MKVGLCFDDDGSFVSPFFSLPLTLALAAVLTRKAARALKMTAKPQRSRPK
jgi:hypothetical protein